MNRIKADSIVEGCEALKGQSKLIFYAGKLYISTRYAKKEGLINNLSLAEILTKYGLLKIRLSDEFDAD